MKTIKNKIVKGVSILANALLSAALLVSVGCGQNGCNKKNLRENASATPLSSTNQSTRQNRDEAISDKDITWKLSTPKLEYNDKIAISTNTSGGSRCDGPSRLEQANLVVNQQQEEVPVKQSKPIAHQAVIDAKDSKNKSSKEASKDASLDMDPKSLQSKLKAAQESLDKLIKSIKENENKIEMKTNEKIERYTDDLDGRALFKTMLKNLEEAKKEHFNARKKKLIDTLDKFMKNATEATIKEEHMKDMNKLLIEVNKVCQEAKNLLNRLKTIKIKDPKSFLNHQEKHTILEK
ncbi:MULTISPECIES: hypothetical protein [unclassified Candidatus Cardinium]|uniref:hypothetical protein n=1 Tax=unclassified Candidatus Cardinium TaxID=2641185 RepID=UPI001FB2BD3A|nr:MULTISPECIES: hypothetical protein [unclassified Candidatus Cardinium]